MDITMEMNNEKFVNINDFILPPLLDDRKVKLHDILNIRNEMGKDDKSILSEKSFKTDVENFVPCTDQHRYTIVSDGVDFETAVEQEIESVDEVPY